MNKIMGAHAVGALGAVVAMLVLLQHAEAQKRHVVGDGQGWRIPLNISTYQNWANQKFSVGDTLMFNFTTGQHNVVEVPKESYDSCNANNAKNTINTGPANITLSSAGEHYYICSYDNGSHCDGGQKLAINVSDSPSAADSPTYTTSPPPPPSSAPTTTTGSAFTSFLLLFFSTFVVVMF